MLPSVDAIVIDLPLFEMPNSFARSTRMLRTFPSTDISMFFIPSAGTPCRICLSIPPAKKSKCFQSVGATLQFTIARSGNLR